MDELNLPIQMYDPKREYRSNKEDIDSAIQTVLNHGLFINGPEVKELESSLAEYVGVKHCIGVSNGTDALKVALLALGVGHDDEVITVSHTWISTAEVISIIGAKPVFVDIDENSFNMDSTKLEEAITPKTKAIIVVSLYGQMPDLPAINTIAEKHSLPVIEDGAQSFGATLNGAKSCGMTIVGTTSFFPSKPLGCYGDGGACFTDDDELAIKIRAIKNHGGTKRFHHEYIGLNARLDTIQAAILTVKFKYFEETIRKRNACAIFYTNRLLTLETDGHIKLPSLADGKTSVWAQYSILVKNQDVRDKIVAHLKQNGVNAAIFYPAPLHSQSCFENLGYTDEDLPVTKSVCGRVFNLPCYADLEEEEMAYIGSLVTGFFENLP